MADKSYYDILGVDKGATEDDVKKAFRAKVKETHPDANPDDPDAEEKFKKVNEAYQTLRDEDKRAAYDRVGHDTYKKGGMGGPGGGDPFAGMGGFDIDLDDILGSFFGGMGGMGGQRRPRPRQGKDIRTTVDLTLEEAVFGVDKEITLPLYEECNVCEGTGSKDKQEPRRCGTCEGTGQQVRQERTPFGIQQTASTCQTCHGSGEVVSNPCDHCDGSGYVKERKTIKASFPQGFDDGMVLKMTGKGAPGVLGGPFGDLLITARIAPHEIFKRDGDTIYVEKTITFPQAALGDTLTIPTLHGDEEYKLPAGTQTGTTKVFNRKGAPNVRRQHQIGDQVVTFKVETPKKLNDEQKELLREYAETFGEHPEEKKSFFDKFK